MKAILDQRPIVVVIAGPNGAGKSTYYKAFLRSSGLRFVNADLIAADLRTNEYSAAKLADNLRRQLIEQRESFIFETFLSDPVGDKIEFLKEAERSGYSVVMFFIGIEGPEVSDLRVTMRVLKGGHDVPSAKIIQRYPRVMNNLKRALAELSHVRVYDNGDLKQPYRKVAIKQNGEKIELYAPTPEWLCAVLPGK